MKSGGLQSLKRANSQALIATLDNANKPLSTADLAARIGISRTTVESILADLIRGDMVKESVGEVSCKGGRPARYFQLNYDAGVVAGIIFNQDEIIITLANLEGRIIFSKATGVASKTQRPRFSIQLLEEALQFVQKQKEELQCVTVSIIGEPTPTGRKLQKEQFPDLSDENFFTDYSTLFECPVLFHNDADLAAMAEYQELSVDEKPKILVVVSISWAFGGGVMIDGKLFTGANSGAAEMGHDNYFGWPKAFKEFDNYRTEHNMTIRGAYAAAQDGDKEVLETIRAFIRRGLPGIRALVCAFDPDLVVISGLASTLSETVLEIVKEDLAEILPVYPEVICSKLKGFALEKGTIQAGCCYLHEHSFGLI